MVDFEWGKKVIMWFEVIECVIDDVVCYYILVVLYFIIGCLY